jgi:hypothetical protein
VSLSDTSGPFVVKASSLSAAGTTQSQRIGVSSAVDWVAIQINLTAIAGTSPTLDLAVEWSMDGGTTWSTADTADSFTQLTATGKVVKRFNVKAPMLRLSEVLGGTGPSAAYTATVYSR